MITWNAKVEYIDPSVAVHQNKTEYFAVTSTDEILEEYGSGLKKLEKDIIEWRRNGGYTITDAKYHGGAGTVWTEDADHVILSFGNLNQ